jgi:maltooligosyltrehalose trehalohydrolase
MHAASLDQPGQPAPRPHRLGAQLLPGGRARFAVWAPRAETLAVELLPREPGPPPRRVELAREGEVFVGEADDVLDGDRYVFAFPDGRRRPDPRSRRQPEGVHGPSALVDFARLRPRPAAALPPLPAWAIYELHVGTFSHEGTFEGVARRLDYLRDELGVSAIELMPVSPFPGTRGWGYDGVHPFAVQESYGGPAGLARLVDAAHERGLAVILDCVYNHLGPDGNYLRDFGPYFTDRHHTPWGEAVNFDGPDAGPVRQYFLDNAVSWIRDYRIDGLRLDAIHAIHDDSTPHVLAEIAAAAQAEGGRVIAESDLNDPVTVLPRASGGWGHDAQWSDDFHHALHALLSGERTGYYLDFGKASDLAAAYARGFVFDGTRRSRYRGGRPHGKSPAGVPAEKHVVALQNHDQVGNRARGDRIEHLAGVERAKLGAAALLVSPGVPLLFQGEEWAASRPFPYFTSHDDPALARAVTEGRRREFEAFGWQGELPDPQDEGTFVSAILDHGEREEPPHRGVLALYRQLLALRRTHPALGGEDRAGRLTAHADDRCGMVTLERWHAGARLALILAFGPLPCDATLQLAPGRWRLVLDTADTRFDGPGAKAPAELHVPPTGRLLLPLPKRAGWLYEWVAANGGR